MMFYSYVLGIIQKKKKKKKNRKQTKGSLTTEWINYGMFIQWNYYM